MAASLRSRTVNGEAVYCHQSTDNNNGPSDRYVSVVMGAGEVEYLSWPFSGGNNIIQR
jgi:hypothetical protein